MSLLNRRMFLQVLAAVSGAAPAALTAQSTRPAGGDRLVWEKTPCPLCALGCGMLVGIQNGRAVAVKGDVDSPVSKGLACAKGYYSVQALYGGDRIRQAMVRRNGVLVPVPLPEAYDLIARKLRETTQKHGKDSIALYGSGHWSITDAYVAGKFFKGGLGSNNIDMNTRLYAASAQAGARGSFGVDGSIGCFDDIDQADVIVLWNHNIAETDPVLFSRILERRRTNRVRLIDLATRTTRTSYAADRTILYAPHAELAIANAICEQIVARHREDREFVAQHVAFKSGRTKLGFGLENEPLTGDVARNASWHDYVKFLRDYTPRKTQQISGVAPEDITWLASLYADPARKVTSIWGSEINQHARGTWVNNLIYNIHLLVGKVGSPGNGAFALGTNPSGSAALHDAGALPHSLPRGDVDNADDCRQAASIWRVPQSRIDQHPGRTVLAAFRGLERGDIRFVWVQGSNPMVSLPNLQRYRRAVRKDDRFIVVSDAYPTATTDVADVVLPAALWIEREGIYANAERRIQHFERMIEPPGNARADARHMIEVARRLGLAELFPWPDATLVEECWNEYRQFHAHPARQLPALKALRANRGVVWPYVAQKETTRRFSTTHDSAADDARGEIDFYGHADHRAWIWLRPYEAPAEAPDAAYPFWLATGSVLEHAGTGSLTRRIPTLHRAVPRAYVELNARDAQELAIRNGDKVRLVSRRGSLELPARVNQRSQPARGQVFVPSFDEHLPINLLTLDACCPLSGQPDYQKCAVRVERV